MTFFGEFFGHPDDNIGEELEKCLSWEQNQHFTVPDN